MVNVREDDRLMCKTLIMPIIARNFGGERPIMASNKLSERYSFDRSVMAVVTFNFQMRL